MKYTVVGIYEDNHQRFCTTVDALTPGQAESLAEAEAGPDLIVAGVFAGDLTPADIHTDRAAGEDGPEQPTVRQVLKDRLADVLCQALESLTEESASALGISDKELSEAW